MMIVLSSIFKEETHRFFCKYDGVHFDQCPCNEDGLCRTRYLSYPATLIHPFDGKNTIKCLCG